MGSLLLEVTFDGEATFPPTTKPTSSTNMPTNNTEHGVLKLGGLKGLGKVEGKEGAKEVNVETNDVNSFHLYKESIEVSMHAELMIEEKLLLGDDVVKQYEDDQFKSTNTANSIPSPPPKNEGIVEFDNTNWVKKHNLTAKRKLQCTFASFAHSISK